MPLTTRNLTPRIGIELTVDRPTLLSGTAAAELKALLVERGVLIVRGMELSDDQQRAFMATLGTIRLGQIKKEGDNGLMKVTFDKKENAAYAEFFVGTFFWHMDGTYEETPPFATVLTPRILAPSGGQTEFANNYAAYEDLPTAEKAFLETLHVVHTMQASQIPAVPDATPAQYALWHGYPQRTHPLVWQHQSGRKSLVLSTSASHVVGMHPAESHALLQRLMRWATQPQYVYQHSWQMNDMLVWDNTGTMHRVLPYDLNCGRRLHRFTLDGEEPVSGVRNTESTSGPSWRMRSLQASTKLKSLNVKPLREDLSFGARVRGVDHALLRDEPAQQALRTLFESQGLIVFEDVEPTAAMHVAISNVFGPMKDHPVPSVTRVDHRALPGVIDMRNHGGASGEVEIAGRRLAHWLPWHFDHCYNNELNRAGVLRAIEIVPRGGLTGFADGIDLYRSLSAGLREGIEGKNVLYRLNVLYAEMRFGKPAAFLDVTPKKGGREVNDHAKQLPRALHPAVWTRASGEKVLHVSPWMADGIEGEEHREGDELLEAVCQEINAKAQAYFHQWNLTDMVIWDNWRMLHSVSGADPAYSRHMQRTTIKGDYGLGFFEQGGVGGKLLEMTV